jgi:hypothetical protein
MYGSLAAFRAYATARGNSAPALAVDADATAALVRASDYIEFGYVARFLPGYDSTVPEVEPATYEAAIQELASPGFWTATFTPSQQKVLTGLKGITWTVTGGTDSDRAYVNATPKSTKIEAMLAKYLPGKFRIGLSAVGPSNA